MIWLAGARLDTLAMGLVILTIGFAQRRPLVAIGALAAWAFAFEALWRLLQFELYFHELELGWLAFVPALLAGSWLLGLAPDRRWLLVALIVSAAWAATGLRANWPELTTFPQGRHPFEWQLELWNAAYTTAWGLAYLPRRGHRPAFRALNCRRWRLMPTSSERALSSR